MLVYFFSPNACVQTTSTAHRLQNARTSSTTTEGQAEIWKSSVKKQDWKMRPITEVIVICKLLLVNPATSATGERSFSMARRVKTWLHANMKQQRLNNVALLHTHKARTDKIRLLDVANEFFQRNDNGFCSFDKFTDLDLSTC